MNLRTLTDELRESMQERSPLSALTETLRVLMDDAAPVGTKHKWADGRTWVKQRDGSWKPDPTSGKKMLALPAGSPVSAPKSKPGTGTATAVVKAPSAAAAAAAPGKATADNLPDDPFKYFHKTPDAKLIPVSALRTIRARPEGIANAAKHMAKAFNGEGDKRKPVSLKDNGDGTYTVVDGNSTTAMARQHNWKNIVATVEPADKQDGPRDADAQVAVDIPGFEALVQDGKLAKDVSAAEHVRIAKDFLGKHAKALQSSLDRLKKVMPEGAKIQGRTKEVKSALGKLVRKPKYQRVDRLQDGTGMRVIVKDARSLDDAINTLKKNYKVVESDDYITQPQGGDSGLGYRSFHAIIEEDGLQKEIQLRTENQHKHGEWCHDVYKPVTPKQEEGMKRYGEVISKYARDVGAHFAALDNGRSAEPPPCPEPVQQYFHCL